KALGRLAPPTPHPPPCPHFAHRLRRLPGRPTGHCAAAPCPSCQAETKHSPEHHPLAKLGLLAGGAAKGGGLLGPLGVEAASSASPQG
ncbi:hypothetical protein, partial [Acidithiobacillus sp.]|uniref:hypothetical protein n=1 Tax=Acidithiobacillus sp. TaxID=1872118 RepID=UPI0025C6AF2B